MPSKMVTQRQKSATDVGAAITNHAQKAQEAIAAVFGPYLGEGESAPDLMPLQSLCGRILEQHRNDIVISDEAHLAELRDDAALRDRRNAAAADLAERLTVIRDGALGLLGPKAAAALLGINGAVERDPVILVRKARRALEVLRSDTLELPRSRLPGVNPEPKLWAAELEGPLQELEESLAIVANNRRQAEGTLIAKQEALKVYDRTFLRVAQLQECLFRIAGLSTLADRVRPSKRRPGQTVVEAEAPTAVDPTADDSTADDPVATIPTDTPEAAAPTA